MKKLYLFALAATMALFSACSSSDDVAENQSPVKEVNGYLAFNIQLPTTPSSRANDVFSDGTANEYAVDNATVYIYKGTSEATATCVGTYTLELGSPTSEPNQITSLYTAVAQVSKITLGSGEKLYALVAINNTVGGTAIVGTQTTGNTLSANGIYTATTNNLLGDVDGATHIFMTNAPLSDKAGGTSDPAATGNAASASTLAVLEANKVFNNKADAKANPAGIVFVERAVAKVTCASGLADDATLTDAAVSGETGDAAKIAATFKGWMLNNTVKSSYIVRDVTEFDTWKGYISNGSGITDHRMVGSSEVRTGKGYRIYWGKTSLYNTAWAAGNFTVATEFTALTGPAYCRENIHPVSLMSQQNNTCAVVKMSLNGGNTFWTVNGSSTVLYDTEAKIKDVVRSYLMAEESVKTYATTNLKSDQTLMGSDFEITFDTPATDGTLAVNTIVLKTGTPGEGVNKMKDGSPAFDATNAITNINTKCKILQYTEGVTYYNAFIRHFDNTQTPWDLGETPAPTNGKNFPNAYLETNREQNYLGRWGVLRNNWYDLKVTEVKKIGSPVIPTLTVDPIDNKDEFMSIEIAVLSWALRTQDVTLQ